jgi:hypothetical protein
VDVFLVLSLVANPISDGLQPPHQGLHEVYQVLPPLKSCTKGDFVDKFAVLIPRPYNFASFHQVFIKNCYGLGVFLPKKLSNADFFAERRKPC